MLSDVWSYIFEWLPIESWSAVASVEKSANVGFNRFVNRRLGNRACLCCGEPLYEHDHLETKLDPARSWWCRVEAFHDTSSCIPLHLPADQQAGWWLCFHCHVFYYQCPDCETFCQLVEHPGKPLFGHDFFRMSEANNFNDEQSNDERRCVDLNTLLVNAQHSMSSSTSREIEQDRAIYYFVSDFRWPLSIIRCQRHNERQHNSRGYYVGDRSDPFFDASQWFPYELITDDRNLEARVNYTADTCHVWKCPHDGHIFKFFARHTLLKKV